MRLATVALPQSGLHVAIIMDGNGRWAVAHAHERCDGHRAGADNVRRIVEAAPGLGIHALTLYAFSRDNWLRPQAEVNNIMALLRAFMESEGERCRREGVRIQVIGTRDKLEYGLLRSIATVERQTARGTRLDLRIALNYSSRDSILAAARRCVSEKRKGIQRVSEYLAGDGRRAVVPDVDLLIRTGGEKRLSDFLLWECAYAELYFTPVLWPDFSPRDLESAVVEFKHRDRRFGSVSTRVNEEKEYWLR